MRLRTLPLAVSSILMGSYLAAWQGRMNWLVAILACLTAICLQILSNLANDYGDSIHGADSATREGPSRAVQSGIISSGAMFRAVLLFAVLSLISGLMLLWVAEIGGRGFIAFLILGILAIAAAYFYTNGSRPYGYAGLGDISVFIFFGLLGVLGTYFLHTGSLVTEIWFPAVSVAAFSVAVLNLNNVRDMISDQEAGKISVPVRLGYSGAKMYHLILIVVGVLATLGFVICYVKQGWSYLFLLVTPVLILNIVNVYRKPRTELDPYLKQMALGTFFYVNLLGIGLLLAS